MPHLSQRTATEGGEGMTKDCEPPVLISLADMPSLFGVAQQTCWRWNTSKGGPGGLPEPDGRLGSVPYWFEDTIREWAGSRRNKLTVDEKVMERLRGNVTA